MSESKKRKRARIDQNEGDAHSRQNVQQAAPLVESGLIDDSEHPATTAWGGVEEELTSYLKEIQAHFATLQDGESKQLLAVNVLGELQGKTAAIASSAEGSYVLEMLMDHAPIQQLHAFLSELMDNDTLFQVASRYVSAACIHFITIVLTG
jgi:hypothetical protein